MRYHNCLAVPAEGLLEDPGQLGVTVVDVVAVAGAQGIDAVSQRQEGAIDVGPFDHALTTILEAQNRVQ